MNEFSKLIKESEINMAKYIDSLSPQKTTFYTKIKRRSIFCSLFHKKQKSTGFDFYARDTYLCSKCCVIWHKYVKVKPT